MWFVVFFFKQKTAYEMRISDWSSDVCSSDLVQNVGLVGRRQNDDAFAAREPVHLGQNLIERLLLLARSADRGLAPGASYSIDFVDEDDGRCVLARFREQVPDACGTDSNDHFDELGRSEEHTSELQSLMRISYAVFCLKKKTNRHKRNNETT